VAAHLGCVLLLLHGFLCLSVGGHALQTALEELQSENGRRCGPEDEAEGGKDVGTTSGGADLATTEEKLAEESREGDEATKVEEGVDEFERGVNNWEGDCEWVSWGDGSGWWLEDILFWTNRGVISR
jgi:hypothetical protein